MMYKKIIENLKRHLPPSVNISTSNENTIPIDNEENIQQTLSPEEVMDNFSPESFDAKKIYENEHIEIYIERAIHQRHLRFQLQDFLYNVKIKVKNSTKRPLLSDLLNILEKVFKFILNNLRSYFKEEDHNVVYLDIFQSPMINALNSGGFLLSDDSNEIVDRILGILYQFLNSDQNMDLELNDTFKVYINVLSVDHVNFQNKSKRNNKNYRKHYGASKKKHNFKWGIDIPEITENDQNIFKNKCFLLCVILGLLQNAYFKSDRVDTRFIYAQGINYSSAQKQNHAKNILILELKNMVDKLSLTENGPYDIFSTSEKISKVYQCQIFVFGGEHNNSKLKYLIPSEVDDSLQPIYLYEPIDDSNHLIFIKNLQSYFKANLRVCFQCFKTFKCYRYMHRCQRSTTCFACRRKYQKKTTYVHEKLKQQYCDSEINKSENVLFCSICNIALKTKHCQSGHKNFCNGKGQFGYKCLKCNKFTYRRNNDTSESIRKTHKCGTKACNICGNFYNPDSSHNIHICPLRNETFSKNWPSLAFIKIMFINLSSEECAQCFDIKKKFSKENNMSLKDVLKQKSNDVLQCNFHLANNNNLEANLIMIYKEHKVQRGLFSRETISHILSDNCEENVFEHDYIGTLNAPSKFVTKTKKLTQDLKTILKKLENMSLEYISVINQFFRTILCDPNSTWKNTTFIMEDADSIAMVKLKPALSHNISYET